MGNKYRTLPKILKIPVLHHKMMLILLLILLEFIPAVCDTVRMDYQKLITLDPAKRNGKPCIRDLRITVYDVLEYLASGMTEEVILQDFPDLTSDDIRACLAFAADRERKLLSLIA